MIKVIIKLISSGARAESPPSAKDINTEISMNKALTRSAMPTFLDITLRFILRKKISYPLNHASCGAADDSLP